MYLKLFLCAVSIFASLGYAQEQSKTTVLNELQILISHSFGGEYTHRTIVKVVTKSDGKQTLIYPEKNGIFSSEDLEGFKALLADKGLYRIKIRAGNETAPSTITSIPAVRVVLYIVFIPVHALVAQVFYSPPSSHH
jgi:hypothetical protein